MDIHVIYFIGAAISLLIAWRLMKYYNNGRGIMHSVPKCIALFIAIVLFLGFIILINLGCKHGLEESLLEIFNNLTCTFLGIAFAFTYKNRLFSIKKPRPFNEDLEE